MEISGYGLFSTQEIEETERIRRNKRSGSALENMGGASTDTVSISDEARAMYAEMKAMQSGSGSQKSTSDTSSESSSDGSSDGSPDSSNSAGSSTGMYSRKSSSVGSSGDTNAGSNGSMSDNAGDDDQSNESTNESGKSGGSGSSGASESTTDAIQKQIDQLQAKLQNVATSSLPENAKQSAMSMYQAQIAELEQQLNQLKQAQ